MTLSDLLYEDDRTELLPFVPSTALRVLDVGCSTGLFGAGLKAQRPDVQVWGIEPDAARAREAASHLDRVVVDEFPVISGELQPGEFDLVCFNDVLEHMTDPAAALAAVPPLLSPTGGVLASIPNIRHVSVLWPLVRHGRFDYHEAGPLDRTHLRFFTRSSIGTLFAQAGWQVDQLVGINVRAQWWHAEEGARLHRVRRLAGGRLDDFFAVQYVVLARPAPA